MALSFDEALQYQLDEDPKLKKSAFGRRAMRVLNLPESNPRRRKVLARMENHARVHLGKSPTQRVDWGKVSAFDWSTIIQLLMLLLPLLIDLFL